jgi:hypothetical protein
MEKVIDRVMRTYGMMVTLDRVLEGQGRQRPSAIRRRSEISPWRSTFAHTACPALTAPSGLGGAAQYADFNRGLLRAIALQ